jgi:opacity protein-like surface antigen
VTPVKRIFLASVLIIAVLASAAAATAAVYGPGTPSRQQYVAKAEKVCTKTDRKMSALTKAASKEAKAGDAKRAGNKFGQVASAFAKGVGQLKKLPRPTADRAKLAKWVRSLGVDVKLLAGEAKAYKAGNAGSLSKAVKAAKKHAPKTNAFVAGFGFHSCLVSG